MTRKASTNRYFVLRHGHSQGNEMGLVVSDLQRGSQAFGLTDLGQDQVRVTVRGARENGKLDRHAIVVSSPFLRAVETARLAVDLLQIRGFTMDPRLRERFCGSLELGSEEGYAKVWDNDRRDPGHTEWNVESVCAIATRLEDLLTELDGRHQGRTILLVAHGDVASTLLCWAAGEDLRRHREVGALATAGLAEVVFRV